VQTTDCSYFDYLKIEKCHKVLKKLQKLQRHLDMSMLELTKEISSDEKVTEDILSKVNALSDSEDISVVEELCGSLEDLRNLKLIALIATDQNSVQSFLENAFKLYDSDLGGNAVSNETMERILQTVMFLNPKESKEVVEATSKNAKVEKIDLEEYLNTRKPNYVKVIKSWETGLVRVKDDLLAMSRDLTRRMEKVAETGSNFLSAGKDAVSDVKDALNIAVTSLHKRTGSRSEHDKKEEKSEVENEEESNEDKKDI